MPCFMFVFAFLSTNHFSCLSSSNVVFSLCSLGDQKFTTVIGGDRSAIGLCIIHQRDLTRECPSIDYRWSVVGMAGQERSWAWLQYKDLGLVSIWRPPFPGMGITMLKIRRSRDRLIFGMGIPILVRWHLLLRCPKLCRYKIPAIKVWQLL